MAARKWNSKMAARCVSRPDSEVDFTRLALGDDGQKLSTVQLVSGTVYADLHPKTLRQRQSGRPVPAEFCSSNPSRCRRPRIFVWTFGGANRATLAVFKGKLSAASPIRTI